MSEIKSAATDQRTGSQEANQRQFAWVVLAITGITYLSTLRFGFVYSDEPQFVTNPFIKGWRYLPQYFTSGLWKQVFPASPSNYYRPVFLVMSRIGYLLFSTRPAGWHFAAVILHIAVTWMVYLLVRRVSGQFSLAWLSALIFGLHPIHHEVVAWVSGATESICAIFFVGAFLAYLESLQKSRAVWLGWSCALYGLALLSKETAVILPALVFAYEWLRQEPREEGNGPGEAKRARRAVSQALPYLPIALAYLLARNQALRGLGHSLVPIAFPVWLRTLPSILLAYATHWFYPIHLAEFYDVLYQTKTSWMHVILPAAILAALAAAVWLLRKRLDEKLVGFTAAWIVLALLPALDTFVFSPEELVHDRYFYLPSIGASILMALIISGVMKTRTGPFGLPVHITAIGLALAAVLTPLGIRAASFWTDDSTLFSRGHEIAPQNSTAETNLASSLIAQGKLDAAQELLEVGYRQHSDDASISALLGRIQYSEKNYAQAEEYARRAVALNPNQADLHFFLGQILLKENATQDAQDNMRRAVELNPYSANFHMSYGIALQVNGNCAEANQQFEAARTLEPGQLLVPLLEAVDCHRQASPPQAGTKPGQP